MEQNYFEKVHQNEITLKRDVQTTLIFDTSKTYQKEILKQPRLLIFQNHVKTRTSKLHQFSIHIT